MTKHLTTLYPPEIIQQRIQELARQINDDYRGKDIMAVGVLNGAFIFMADLVRAISVPVQCEFVRISSYGNEKFSSGNIKLLLDIDPEKIGGQHVLLIEDIVDSGNSIVFLQQHFRQYRPASLKVCSLLLKEAMLKQPVAIDYLGFKIDPLFVVGYGLDFAGKYRNHPALAIHQ